MDAIFALGSRASAEDIRARLTEPPSYSAVRTMLARLEAKGVIRHHEEGLRYVYTPAKSKTSAQKTALEKLVNVFFGGSRTHTAAALLHQEPWTDDELDALTTEIEILKNKNRRQP